MLLAGNTVVHSDRPGLMYVVMGPDGDGVRCREQGTQTPHIFSKSDMELDEHRRQAATSESLEARMPWLEGQVRRLQQQLDTKGKALAASDAAVSSLENKVQRLQRQLRQAEAHAGRAEGGASSREHDQEALELESELLRMEEALRVSKSAALRSAKEAEREREARAEVEQDLQAITMSAPAEVPAKLLERLAHIEAELARERRARTDAETQVACITASMVGEIEEMSATRSGALAELRYANVSRSLLLGNEGSFAPVVDLF